MDIKNLIAELGPVKLIAVTKYVQVEKINDAILEGVTDIGESRVSDFADKLPHLLPCKRHMIGHLQSNKVAAAVKLFDMIQSVDSLKLLEAIDKNAEKINKIQEVLLQVNIGREPQKYGIFTEDLDRFILELKKFKHIIVKGLMCIPPESEPEKYFKQMKQIFDRYKDKNGFETLSMGMSADYKVAIAEGSTMVRIGTAIFKDIKLH